MGFCEKIVLLLFIASITIDGYYYGYYYPPWNYFHYQAPGTYPGFPIYSTWNDHTHVSYNSYNEYTMWNNIAGNTHLPMPAPHFNAAMPHHPPIPELAPKEGTCGKTIMSYTRKPLITNGNTTIPGAWPWQVALSKLQKNGKQLLICGGSLLNEYVVITAAHCLTRTGSTSVLNPDEIVVYLGKQYRSDFKDDAFVQIRLIQDIHIFPDYNPQSYDGDLAIIHLQLPVYFNERVQPICLPTPYSSHINLQHGKKGVVTGWGTLQNGSYSEVLQEVILPVVANRECERGFASAGLPQHIPDEMICAGYKYGVYGACTGDSGGPYIFWLEGKWVLEGVLSWGSENGCSLKDQYGGYTKVSKYLDWINNYL